MNARLAIDREAIAEFCRRHDIRKLSLFGSALRDDFDPDRSDIDVLVEFAPASNRCLSYFGLVRMQFELETIFGRSVDLSLADSLDPYLRSEVLATAEPQYVAA
jgi:predicted nucleotidyltransferase